MIFLYKKMKKDYNNYYNSIFEMINNFAESTFIIQVCIIIKKQNHVNKKKYLQLSISELNSKSVVFIVNNYRDNRIFVANVRRAHNNQLMFKYYKLAIQLNDSDAMFNLGVYYRNYPLMEKYYQMAINLGNTDAINNLGTYYEDIQYYQLMEKYLKLAIDLGDMKSMNSLGKYYQKIKDYTQML